MEIKTEKKTFLQRLKMLKIFNKNLKRKNFENTN